MNWLIKNGLKLAKSFEKELPDSFMNLSDEKICLFLKHLWSTDGNISYVKTKTGKEGISIYYSSTSKKLIYQIQHLLLRLGIISTIRIKRRKIIEQTG